MSRGCAQSLKKECVGLVVGPVVFIVEKNAIIFPEFSFYELGYLNPAIQNRTVRMDVVSCVWYSWCERPDLNLHCSVLLYCKPL